MIHHWADGFYFPIIIFHENLVLILFVLFEKFPLLVLSVGTLFILRAMLTTLASFERDNEVVSWSGGRFV
jgi:hypothetical protein